MADLAIITEGQITKCPEGSRLPFIPTETKRIGGGGYSTVYKEVIASRHFIYDQNSASTLSNEASPAGQPLLSCRLILTSLTLYNEEPFACSPQVVSLHAGLRQRICIAQTSQIGPEIS